MSVTMKDIMLNNLQATAESWKTCNKCRRSYRRSLGFCNHCEKERIKKFEEKKAQEERLKFVVLDEDEKIAITRSTK